MIKHLPKNINGKDFIVGDVHGYYDILMSALKHINFDKTKDRLFSVGDIVDRGPQCIKILSLLEEPWFYMVRGNHEQLMIDTLCKNEATVEFIAASYYWYQCGGWWYRDLPDADKEYVKNYLPILNELPYIISVSEGTDRFNIVHAELTDDLMSDNSLDNLTELEDTKYIDKTGLTLSLKETIVWKRSIFSSAYSYRYIQQDIFSDKYIPQDTLSRTFCGHTIVNDVCIRLKHINIDTGLYYGGKLTIINADRQHSEYYQFNNNGFISSNIIKEQ